MQYLTLNNGLSMPIVGFGTWSLRGGACVRAVRTAFDCGIGLVDTASFYENEREVGRAVREAVRMLMNTGQVSVQQGRGTFVLRHTPAGESLSQRLERALPDESAEVLALLEGMMARLAANRRTAEQLNRMDETLLRRRQMAERHDAHGVDETEQQFYDLLARAAGNPLLTDLHHALAHSLRTRTAPSGSQPETDDDLQAMYENLVRQITEQNAKKSGKIAQNIRTAHH